MTQRAWDAVRRVALELERRQRDRTGSGEGGHLGREDLVLLLAALALPTDVGPPRRPDTWITVKGCYAWWAYPVGETDPDKVDVWLAVLEDDGQPACANALRVEQVEQWEGTPWAERRPTGEEMRRFKVHIIAALGFLSAGPPISDPLTEAADKILRHIAAVLTDTGPHDAPSLAQAYENGVRGATGGVYGDFAGGFNTDVGGHLATLLKAIATDAPADTVRRLAESISQSYLDARSRDDDYRSR